MTVQEARAKRWGVMHSVFTILGDGEMLFIASRDSLEQAIQLAKELNAAWPHDYRVRDSKG